MTIGTEPHRTLGSFKTEIERELKARFDRDLKQALAREAQKHAATSKAVQKAMLDMRENLRITNDKLVKLERQAAVDKEARVREHQLQVQAQHELQDQVRRLQQRLQASEKGAEQPRSDTMSRNYRRIQRDGIHETQPARQQQLQQQEEPEQHPVRRRTEERQDRQLFIRTEAALPRWALANDGNKAMDVLTKAGIHLPNGVSSCLHREGVTNAFILSFENPRDADSVLHQAIRLRLFQPGHERSIKVQWKRLPRDRTLMSESQRYRPPREGQLHSTDSSHSGIYGPADRVPTAAKWQPRNKQPQATGASRGITAADGQLHSTSSGHSRIYGPPDRAPTAARRQPRTRYEWRPKQPQATGASRGSTAADVALPKPPRYDRRDTIAAVDASSGSTTTMRPLPAVRSAQATRIGAIHSHGAQSGPSQSGKAKAPARSSAINRARHTTTSEKETRSQSS
jgi:hypothetical protein